MPLKTKKVNQRVMPFFSTEKMTNSGICIMNQNEAGAL